MSKVYIIRLQRLGIQKFEFVAQTQFLFSLQFSITKGFLQKNLVIQIVVKHQFKHVY